MFGDEDEGDPLSQSGDKSGSSSKNGKGRQNSKAKAAEMEVEEEVIDLEEVGKKGAVS